MAKTSFKYPQHDLATTFWQAPLPHLLAWITNHRRHKVDNLEFGKLLTFNLFRLWEKVFWRRCGESNNSDDTIRAEADSFIVKEKSGRIIVVNKFYTVESFAVYVESTLRDFFARRLPKFEFIKIPALITPDGQQIDLGLRVPFISFAIAFDAATAGQTSASTNTLTVSFTSGSGSNRCMVAGGVLVYSSGTPTVSSLAYGGTNMTQVYNYMAFTSRAVFTYYLLNQATGTNNLVLSASGVVSSGIAMACSSYSGVKQSGQPDANNKVDQNSSSSTVTLSLTTVANNCWVVGIIWSNDGTAPTAGSGATSRAVSTFVNSYAAIYDSNSAKTPAGSYSMTINATTSSGSGATLMLISLAPLGGTNWTQTCSETINHTDTLIKSIVRTLSESITDTDTFASVRIRTSVLLETINHTDSLIKMANKALVETINHTDTFIKNAYRIFTETINHTDILVALKIKFVQLTETINHTDSLIRIISLSLLESITHTDTFISARTRALALLETISNSDTFTFARNYFRTFTEIVSNTADLIVAINGVVTNMWSKVARSIDTWIKTPRN